MYGASVRFTWLAAALLATFIGVVALTAPSIAKAEETVWICKPGQVDDLCAGSISTSAGYPPEVIGYQRPERAPVDCFYVYPTVSSQNTPNANLDKDPEVKRVVVQQARQFSRVCDVYAPMYRQDTSPGVYTERTQVAYESALSAWKDYLANYNKGRGVILLGHSQGSATVGQLIRNEIDQNPALREKLVGAILPGGNIHVPKGELVGGMYENVPVCSKVGEFGCLVAYSMFNGNPGENPPFADVGSGYWAYDIPRPSRTEYEVVCADPAQLSGNKLLTPLVNLDYLLNPPENGVETGFYSAFPDQISASCEREGTKHWLNAQYTENTDPLIKIMVVQVASGSNWHVPEVNFAENNLVQIAQLQTDSFVAEEKRMEALKSRLKTLNSRLKKAKRTQSTKRKQANKLAKRAKKAKGKQKRRLSNSSKRARRQATAAGKQVKTIQRQINQVKKQIG